MLRKTVYSAVSRWVLRVPTQNIAVMRLFSITDIPYMLALSPRVWLQLVLRLRRFQKNIATKEWASLAQVYPRSLMWTYAYALFLWARYCDRLEAILSLPDKCLAAEVFLRHICEIDQYLDGFDSRAVLVSDPQGYTRVPAVGRTIDELHAHLERPDISKPSQAAIVNMVATYTERGIAGLRRWAASESDTLDKVIEDKERTAGDLWRVWSRLLGYLYEIPPALAESASEFFFNYGMVIQVFDDLSDVPQDHRIHAENLFLSIAQETPGEWERLQAYLDGLSKPYLTMPWIRENLPHSLRQTMNLYSSYADKIRFDTCQPALASEVSAIVERMLTLFG